MVSVDITDPSMADAEVMDMDDFKASVDVGKGEKVSELTELRRSYFLNVTSATHNTVWDGN